MKLIAACIVFCISLSAFAASPATDGAGRCSAQLMNDIVDIDSLDKAIMKRFTDEFINHVKRDTPAAEFNARREALTKELQDRLNTFRATYGEFECETATGKKISSVEMYKFLDMAQPPVAKDGECGPEIKSDYLAMTEQLEPLTKLMVAAMPEILRKAQKGEIRSEYGQWFHSVATTSLGIRKSFRAKHPGAYSCSLVMADGEPVVLESADIDSDIESITKSIQSLN